MYVLTSVPLNFVVNTVPYYYCTVFTTKFNGTVFRLVVITDMTIIKFGHYKSELNENALSDKKIVTYMHLYDNRIFFDLKKNLSKAVIFALSLLSSLVFFNQTSLTKSSYLQVLSAMMVSMSSWEISVMARDVPVLSKELKSPRLILLKLGMAKMENYLLKKSMISLMLSLMILTRMNCDCEKQNF